MEFDDPVVSRRSRPGQVALRRLKRSTFRSLAAVLALVLQAACVQSVPSPPKPAAAPQPPLDLPASVLQLPVYVDLDLVRGILESKVPKVVDGEGDWERHGALGVQYRVERGPLDVSFRGGELQVDVPLRYRGKACVQLGPLCPQVASCGHDGEGLRALDLTLRTPLSLSKGWQLRTDIDETHRFQDPCRVSFLRVDVRKEIDDMLGRRLAPMLSALDGQLSMEAGLRSKAQAAWKRLQRPIEVSPGVWLVMEPEKARISQPRRSGDKVRFDLGVMARPRLVLGEEPRVEERPLPPLQEGRFPGESSVHVEVQIPYEEATRMLRDLIVGRGVEAGGHHTVVRDVAVWGSGDGAVLRLDLETDRGFFRRVRGTVFIVGRPSYDAEAGVLSLEELDYSLETKNLPVQVAEVLLRPELLEILQQSARFDVGDYVDEARRVATQELGGEVAPGIRLSGALERVEPVAVFAGKDAFFTHVTATGKASAQVHVPKPPRPSPSRPSPGPTLHEAGSFWARRQPCPPTRVDEAKP